MQAANQERFRELILYISLRSEGDEAFGVTKLDRLLYFIDAEALRRTGETMTGQTYVKSDLGPVPERIEETLRALDDESALVVRPRIVSGFSRQRRPFALRGPELGLFTAAEVCLIETVLARYRSFTARQCSILSHRKYGWQLAAMGETIPVSTELISERDLTLDEMAYAEDLVEEPEFRGLASSHGG